MEFSKVSRTFRKKNGHFNFDLAYILYFYDAYLRERSIRALAAVMGMTNKAMMEAIQRHPELQQAMEIADENRTKGVLSNYVQKSLSPEARKTWEKLAGLETWEAIELTLKNKPLRLRQQLFCYAILYTGYDMSKACAMVAIDRAQIERWKADPEFLQMLEEVQFHKKNFFEKGLIGLVHENHPGAILFVNRTYNADRGYSERLDLNQNARPSSDWDVGDLDLDLETMKKVLAAIEKKKAAEEGPDVDGMAAQLLLPPAKKAKAK